MKQSETHIAQLLQEKNRQVIEQLYDQYSAALFGIVLKIVQSQELAEDVLQETFVKIWSNGSTYDAAKGTIFTWMLNIARNTAIDKLRSGNNKKKAQVNDLDQILTSERLHPTAELSVDHIGVAELVDGLEEKYRELIDLVYFKGYTQEEITQNLGLPLGTVKSRLRIAMRELRRIFGAPFFIGLILVVFFVVDEVQSLFWQIDWVIFIRNG
jgi:RNA polymerase sigma-70 factor (ECF subfamily)